MRVVVMAIISCTRLCTRHAHYNWNVQVKHFVENLPTNV